MTPTLASDPQTDDLASGATTDDTARLVDWLLANGAELAGVAIEDCDGERGVRATADLPEGSVVARIPQSLFITLDVAKQSRIGRALAALPQAIHWRTYLAAFLLETRRDGGFWAPYVDALPKAFPGHPIQFGPLEWLAISPISNAGSVMNTVRDSHRDAWDAAAEVLAAEGHDRAAFDWASCCVRTRCYEDTRGAQGVSMLVPFADLLNHVNQPATRATRQPEGDYVIEVQQGVAGGSEITASYGEYGNEVLKSIYGFCLEDNEFDRANLLVQDQVFLVRRPYAHPDVRAMFRGIRCRTWMMLGDVASTDPDHPLSADHEFRCLDALYKATEVALARSLHGLSVDDAARTAVDRASPAGSLLAAIESERNVLWHFASLATIAGRVLRDRGAVPQDRALLAYIDRDYAADIMKLVDPVVDLQGVTA